MSTNFFKTLHWLALIFIISYTANGAVYFKNKIAPGTFIGGVVYCTEENEYGTVYNYACNKNVADGSRVNDIAYKQSVKLSDAIFVPYHSTLKILSLSLTRFAGDINGAQTGTVSCDFTERTITKGKNYCIIFPKDATDYNACIVKHKKC